MLEKEKQIFLLKHLDMSEIVSEDRWHDLCQTPLRTSDLLAQLVLNIFPDAEGIHVGCNYVYFTLYGYEIQIPTSLCRGINVDTTWFCEFTTPRIIFSRNEERMKRYFECLDTKAGWYKCARYRLGRRWQKWYLFVIWWTRYKWKNAHREEWEAIFDKAEKQYQERLSSFYDKKKQMDEKIISFVETVLPEINRFSKEHYEYDGNITVRIDKILEAYKKII
ncbi:MAG: hypothetical protein RR365_08620 [Bacteroides sp.]